MTGSSEGSGTSGDYATIKYNNSSVEQWVARYNGPGNGLDLARDLAIDASGNVYVTGLSPGSGTSDDYATIKYNSEGVEQWVARYNGPGNSFDEAVALAIDPLGNVYMTGSSDGSGTSGDYTTIKYNSAGFEQWVARYNGPENFSDRATALAIDAAGNVYVTGKSEGSGTRDDYATVKYNSAGVEQWVARYNGPGNSFDQAVALAVDPSGNVFVTGWSQSQNFNWQIYTTIKYVQTLVSVEEEEPKMPNSYLLAQNYPNPFNPSTTIRYAIAKPGHVTLKVFNLQGQEIATLVNENKAAGEYEIRWNPTNAPSGVYVYRLHTREFVETKKLILLK